METGIPEIRTGTEAMVDALTVVHVTHNYSDWGFGFLLWHSSYFSVCVWLAIFLMRGPRKLAGRTPAEAEVAVLAAYAGGRRLHDQRSPSWSRS